MSHSLATAFLQPSAQFCSSKSKVKITSAVKHGFCVPERSSGLHEISHFLNMLQVDRRLHVFMNVHFSQEGYKTYSLYFPVCKQLIKNPLQALIFISEQRYICTGQAQCHSEVETKIQFYSPEDTNFFFFGRS